MGGTSGLIEEDYKSRKMTEVDRVAKAVLERVLPLSVKFRCEIGGMIYREGGVVKAGKPRTSRDGGAVNTGLGLPNHGCPPNTTPVANYHTHGVAWSSSGVLIAQSEVFSSKERQGVDGEYDEELAVKHGLNAYLGTLLGRFLVFEAATKRTYQLGRLNNEWSDASKSQIHDMNELEMVD